MKLKDGKTYVITEVICPQVSGTNERNENYLVMPGIVHKLKEI